MEDQSLLIQFSQFNIPCPVPSISLYNVFRFSLVSPVPLHHHVTPCAEFTRAASFYNESFLVYDLGFHVRVSLTHRGHAFLYWIVTATLEGDRTVLRGTVAYLWFKHIYFITSIHSTYTQYITGGLGWTQKLIRTLSKHTFDKREEQTQVNEVSTNEFKSIIASYKSCWCRLFKCVQ